MTQVKEALLRYMDQSGKTYEDVACDLGVARTSLFNKVRGQYAFTLEEAYRLSRMLDCTLDDLYSMTQA